MFPLVATLLLSLAGAPGAPEAGGPALEREVDRLVRSGALVPGAFDRPIVAPPTGGPLGWLIVGLYGWYPELDGDVQLGDDAIDIQDDLGITDNEIVIMPQVQVSLGAIGFRLGGFFARFEGSGTVAGSFEFGGVTFDVGEDVDSRVRIDAYRIQTMVPIVRTDFLQIAFLGGLSLYDVDVTIDGSLSGRSEESATIPLPAGGVLVQAKLGPVLLEGEISGFYLEIEGYGGSAIDAQLSVGVTALKVVAVRVGYRFFRVDIHDNSDFNVDVRMQGFFAGVSLQF